MSEPRDEVATCKSCRGSTRHRSRFCARCRREGRYRVEVTLTGFQIRTLLYVAEEGFDGGEGGVLDGNFFVVSGQSTGRGQGKRSVSAYYRAKEQLEGAMRTIEAESPDA